MSASFREQFTPKLFTTLKNYSAAQFGKDLLAGVVVGIVALPLAIAFGIASGVTPEKGLITAIIAGFLISALGGSRVQIGGPTGAFIVIVYGIVEKYGVDGLIISTFMAGVILVLMGIVRLGSVIRFVPHPLIVGFTSGIAILIFSSQVKDFFGLTIDKVPADFIAKWNIYFHHFDSVNWIALAIGAGTILISFIFPKITHRIPGSIIAILLATFAVQYFHLPVETIQTKFGVIPSSLPHPVVPNVSFDTIKQLMQPAFTIALLGAIESLLSAVVADGMIGGSHRSNMELIAQGTANIFSSLFGGIPATGAIARTATNVKNGGRTPVAGMIHALTLLLIMLFVGKWAALIPMSCLAGILVVVSYNMSEYKSFISLLRGPKPDVAILLTTFLLTLFFDLTVAIEIGMVLSSFLFMHRMSTISKVNVATQYGTAGEDQDDPKAISKYKVPDGVDVFEIKGPLFFGAAYKFKESLRVIEKTPKVIIIRMRQVPVIDATGLHTLEEVHHFAKQRGSAFLISGIQPAVLEEMQHSGFLKLVGEENVLKDIESALERAELFLSK
ncbi:MAG TPA: sulfate permease [Bacteroidia bacterium]|jgi:SulP family sulfate permease|nr:sulfate permease [Bacteroidia bacterium]